VLRLLSALVVLALGTGLAVAAAGGVPGSAGKSAALGRLASVATTDSNTTLAPGPRFAAEAIPARMLGPEVPVPVSPARLRARNGWLVSDGEKLVAVYAGASGSDSAVGRVVVVRQDLAAGKQTEETVDAGPTGALTIAHAPLGVTSATGEIRLRTAGGKLLLLELGDGQSHAVLTVRGYVDHPWSPRSSDSTSHPIRR
jgi:hypothetical protein